MGYNIQSSNLFLFFLVVVLASSSADSEAGKVQDLGGLSTYISGSLNSKTSIILIADVYGYENPRLRELADKVAAAGFYAVLPDFFHGEPFIRGGDFAPWFNKHSPEKGYEDAKPLIDALKCKGITKIGIAGFCWGGKVAVLLSSNGYNQALVLLHPTYVGPNDIKGVKVPVSILGGEFDAPKKLKLLEDALKEMPETSEYSMDDILDIYICGLRTKLEVSWSTKDPGRRFRACKKFGTRYACDHFEWFDPPVCSRAKKIVLVLLHKVKRLEVELKK